MEPLIGVVREIDDFCNVKYNLNDKDNWIKENREEVFSNSLDELMEQSFTKAQRRVGKDIHKMQKEDKIEMVRCLKKHGIFLVKDAIDRISERLNVSRFTIYNYLVEIKPGNDNVKKVL